MCRGFGKGRSGVAFSGESVRGRYPSLDLAYEPVRCVILQHNTTTLSIYGFKTVKESSSFAANLTSLLYKFKPIPMRAATL